MQRSVQANGREQYVADDDHQRSPSEPRGLQLLPQPRVRARGAGQRLAPSRSHLSNLRIRRRQLRLQDAVQGRGRARQGYPRGPPPRDRPGLPANRSASAHSLDAGGRSGVSAPDNVRQAIEPQSEAFVGELPAEESGEPIGEETEAITEESVGPEVETEASGEAMAKAGLGEWAGIGIGLGVAVGIDVAFSALSGSREKR